jgi:hypothetical protein
VAEAMVLWQAHKKQTVSLVDQAEALSCYAALARHVWIAS